MKSVLLLSLLPLVWAAITEPVDLTKHFDENTVYWAGSKTFNHSEDHEDSSNGVWRVSRDIEACEHGGTHMDAPYHFNKKGWRLGDIPFQRFFGKAVHVDLKKEASANRDYIVEPAVLEQWETTNGKIPEGAIVLLNFNWTHKTDNKTDYFGSSNPQDTQSYHFPGLGAEAAKLLINRKVFGVGTDAVSIDPGQIKDYKAHQLLSEQNIFILEQAALNVTELPATGYRILALPWKIRYGTGAPCRLVAMP